MSMKLVCMRHGTPINAEDECEYCIYDELNTLKEYLDESKRRKVWESRHNKVLGK